MTRVSIGSRVVGAGEPCFVIAEAGVNHNGDVDQAMALVDAAREAGADAVKFQTFVADALVSPTAAKADYQKRDGAADESQLDMIRRFELPFDAFRKIQQHATTTGILFLSTPFDEASADFLRRLDVPAFKVGSGDVTNLPFLDYLAAAGRPIILSTGMSTLDDVRAAVDTIRRRSPVSIVLLHCVSNYPAAAIDANLRAMQTLADVFDVPVGFSDHTLGNEVALAAVALGAYVIEKHLTLDQSLPGPDHAASLTPALFRALTSGIRTVESALGDGIKRPRPSEAGTAAVARRSLVATRDLAAGTVLTAEMIAVRRPGTGVPPASYAEVIGRTLNAPRQRGEVLTWDVLS